MTNERQRKEEWRQWESEQELIAFFIAVVIVVGLVVAKSIGLVS